MAGLMEQGQFASDLMEVLEEAFDTHHGVFLDRGTSLFETLDGLTPKMASKPIVPGRTVSIASHVEHIIFYLDVLGRHMAGEGDEIGELDWGEIWARVGVVTESEWRDLLRRLRDKYEWVVEILEGIDDWRTNDAVGASLAILAHTACHLGVIRQAIPSVRQA